MITPKGLHWGYKFVSTDLATDDHRGGRHRYQLGKWHKASAPSAHNDPCPKHPGDGLCVALTLGGAQSGGTRIGASVGLLVGYRPSDVLATTTDKVRVRRLWVAPDPFDPVWMLIGPGTNLIGANLTRANLTEANLTEANLIGANLTGANLTRANLIGANLTEANLTEAHLYGANITRANLTRANLTEANLTGASGVVLPPGWTLDACCCAVEVSR